MLMTLAVAAIVVIGVMVYATVGVVIYRYLLADPELSSSTDGDMCAWMGATWPLILVGAVLYYPVRYVVWPVVMLPYHLGNWIANRTIKPKA